MLAALIFRMLRYGQDYVDEGVAAYEARFQQRRLLHGIVIGVLERHSIPAGNCGLKAAQP